MKKIVLLGLLITSAASPAMAISRYNSMSMTCAEARATISRERAVIMRYPAKRTPNMTLYDRYVVNSDACDLGYYAYQDYLPTKDRASCPVYTCRPTTDLDDDELIFRR
ncbi:MULTISPECIES: hypothetical protein [Rhizobium]|jgi:hypothetical protein|uniref:hypothetical protein n=1 Tax=Rhizobium TaxID=379 RepID=UPI00056CFD1D|nr:MULTISPECIES: hypothetical protein [Rhizobium]NKJ07322.1 hypothetical protein [Rhizobium sp. SG741]NKJ34322.1 hypothetical protein [Rhizobium sp. SG570]NRP85161.1 hypothetical protein [Ensifer adhaerens]NTJ06645.1 hypothetical protein [Rhizobium lusitanum]